MRSKDCVSAFSVIFEIANFLINSGMIFDLCLSEIYHIYIVISSLISISSFGTTRQTFSVCVRVLLSVGWGVGTERNQNLYSMSHLAARVILI